MKATKKLKRKIFFISLAPFLLVVAMAVLLFGSSLSNDKSSSKGGATTLTAEQVAEKTNISVERAEDVIKILNWQLTKEEFTLEGASGSLANAERESGFNPEAVNNSGGVAGYFQWSGWSNTINGNRWGQASSKKLESDVELDLMSKELNGSYSKVKDYMKTASSPTEAARFWSAHYEGVALSDGQTKLSELESDAKKWYDIFKGTISQGNSAVKGNAAVAAGALTKDLPAGYTLDKGIDSSGYITQSYPWGQCTWYVFNRARDFGISYDPYMGNGGDWKSKAGYTTTNTPTKHSAISFYPGQAGADSTYGHIAFVEDVSSDGSVLISECNALGLGVISYRVFDAESAKQLTYVIGH